MWLLIIFIILTPLFTGIPTGFILVKILRKQDIRKTGSGNIGATNVRRLLGTGWSIVVLVIDALKGAIPVLLVMRLGIGAPILSGWQIPLFGILSILGNVFSPWLGFKGGKGIATSLGVTSAIIPGPLALAAGCFIITAVISNMISLSSIIAACLLPFCILIYDRLSKINSGLPVIIFTVMLALVILWTHRGNIKRLVRGEEPRIIKSKKIH
jgi:acyl phosphate:glycerol-3-phosphate acyltransferase